MYAWYDLNDDYDPPVDEAVKLSCPNKDCEMHKAGEVWHPRTFPEYQGTPEMGGTVYFYEDDDFVCEDCGTEAVEE